MISLLIPAFNEEQAIAETVHAAASVLGSIGEPFEIVVIDDGSTDETSQILKELKIPELHVVHHPQNRGYGASLKTGIRHSAGELIAMTDADGTYPVEELPAMIRMLREREADMVVGARTKSGAKIPWSRRPAKWVVNTLANILVGTPIPDTNSGLRVFTRELAEAHMHLYPEKFSFTLTITLAALTSDEVVLFHPIDYHKRVGKSSLSAGLNGPRNFAAFLALIVRIVTYFRPLRFFAWPSVLLMCAGSALIGWTVYTERNVSDAGLLLLLTGLQIGLFGLLAEVVVRHGRRRDPHVH